MPEPVAPMPAAPQDPDTQPPITQPPITQPPAKRRGCGTVFLITILAVLGLVVVGGLLAWRYIENELLPSVQGMQGMEELVGQFDTIDLVPGPPGPCFDLEVDGGFVTGWDEVACDGPRDVEAFFSAEFRDEAFPGDQYLADAAAHTCGEAFVVYVGTTSMPRSTGSTGSCLPLRRGPTATVRPCVSLSQRTVPR